MLELMRHPSERTQELLRVLDRAESAVVAFYRLLLLVIIAAVLAVAVYAVIHRTFGSGNQGEWFYFAVAVVAVLGWAFGTFLKLGRRQRRRRTLFD